MNLRMTFPFREEAVIPTDDRYSIVAAGSVVSINTAIPPREIWGGMAAVKLCDLQRKRQPKAQ